MGNLVEELCVNCNENSPLDGFYCFHCGIEIYYSEEAPELTLDWKE